MSDRAPCEICGNPVCMDLIVPRDTWAKISPTHDDGGYLCPSCVAVRLGDMLGWPAVRGVNPHDPETYRDLIGAVSGAEAE